MHAERRDMKTLKCKTASCHADDRRSQRDARGTCRARGSLIFMRYFPGCLLGAVLLAGCVTTPTEVDYSATRAGWQGAPYDAVVAQWGQPVRYIVMDDGRYVYSWYSQAGGGGVAYPSTSIGVFGGSRGVGVGVGTGIALPGMDGGEAVRCERTFVFRNAVVVEQTWNGSSQFCSTFVRR
jgi:hypothetical protein